MNCKLRNTYVLIAFCLPIAIHTLFYLLIDWYSWTNPVPPINYLVEISTCLAFVQAYRMRYLHLKNLLA